MPEKCIWDWKGKQIRLQKTPQIAGQVKLELNGPSDHFCLKFQFSPLKLSTCICSERCFCGTPQRTVYVGHVAMDQMEVKESEWVGVMQTRLHEAEVPYGICWGVAFTAKI